MEVTSKITKSNSQGVIFEMMSYGNALPRCLLAFQVKFATFGMDYMTELPDVTREPMKGFAVP